MTEESHIPLLGVSNKVTFPPQFIANPDGRSLSCTPIEFLNPDRSKRKNLHATGFFYRYGNSVFLFSARHVISGLNAFSDQPISQKDGYLPQKILAYPFIMQGQSGYRSKDPLVVSVRDVSFEPRWKEDPEFLNLRTDIACVEIIDKISENILCINESPDENLLSNVGVDCFVVGYPSQNYATPLAPIWRRGVMATEPMVPIDDKPIFLVDASTSQGMSGSPIIQRWHGPAPIVNSSSFVEIDLYKVVSSKLIGIYGGRLSSKNNFAEIGYGWYANRIEMIISGHAPKTDIWPSMWMY